jgi:hypothetical protein
VRVALRASGAGAQDAGARLAVVVQGAEGAAAGTWACAGGAVLAARPQRTSSVRGTPEAFAAVWRSSSRQADVRWPIYHTPLACHIWRAQVHGKTAVAVGFGSALPLPDPWLR